MAPALAAAVLEERRGTGLREVIPSTMGEPLLWAGLDRLLDACAAEGLALNVTTNGTFPGRGAEAWAEALLPVASDVKLSWNGATTSTAQAIMDGLDFGRAVEDARRFLAVRDRLAARGRASRWPGSGPATGWPGDRRATVTFQVTAQEANVGELADIVRLAARLGVDRVKVNQLQPRFPWLEERALTRSAEAIAR